MVDDERFQFLPNEKVIQKEIRFRSLGCYPLTAAIESSANTVKSIITELIQTNKSERQGRMVDHASPHSLEQKKQEGHF
jgi:sulfate adenylyltransferase subunit 2